MVLHTVVDEYDVLWAQTAYPELSRKRPPQGWNACSRPRIWDDWGQDGDFFKDYTDPRRSLYGEDSPFSTLS